MVKIRTAGAEHPERQREEPKLTDFGLARREETKQGHTATGAVLETLDFMPPEQRQDVMHVDGRSDLWSLGATLYQMVTGRSPRIVRLDSVSDSLRSVVGTVLEETPDNRYHTAETLRDALRRREQQQVTPATPDDLSSGECLSCHTLNPASRKFCRECGAPLTVPCLSCAETIPVWDKICGECGANQAELVAARQAELEEEKQEAESRRREHCYGEAVAIAEQYTHEPGE